MPEITMSVQFPKNFGEPTVISLINGSSRVETISYNTPEGANNALTAIRAMCKLTGYQLETIASTCR